MTDATPNPDAPVRVPTLVVFQLAALSCIHLAERCAPDWWRPSGLLIDEARSAYSTGHLDLAIVAAIDSLLHSDGVPGEKYKKASALALGLLNKTGEWVRGTHRIELASLLAKVST